MIRALLRNNSRRGNGIVVLSTPVVVHISVVRRSVVHVVTIGIDVVVIVIPVSAAFIDSVIIVEFVGESIVTVVSVAVAASVICNPPIVRCQSSTAPVGVILLIGVSVNSARRRVISIVTVAIEIIVATTDVAIAGVDICIVESSLIRIPWTPAQNVMFEVSIKLIYIAKHLPFI